MKWHKNTNDVKDGKEGGDFSTVWWFLCCFLIFIAPCIIAMLEFDYDFYLPACTLYSIPPSSSICSNHWGSVQLFILIDPDFYYWLMLNSEHEMNLILSTCLSNPQRNTVLNDNWNLPVDIMHNSPSSLIITFAHLSHTRVLSFHFIVQW